jgi:hypothetical protein
MNNTLLSIVAKSRDMLYEQESTFASARILTDIRAVFGENTEIHMLQLL